MTSWIIAKIKGKRVMAKAGGYTGRTEARTPKGDVITANRVWLRKEQVERLGLKYGQKVRIRVGRTVKTGRVLRWSKGSAQIVFDRSGLPRSTKVYTSYKPTNTTVRRRRKRR